MHTHSEPNNLDLFNSDDDVDFKTSSSFFVGDGNDDDAFFTAGAAISQPITNPCVSTIGQEDHLLSTNSPSSSNINLFARDHEECLPPVNIGADVRNLWTDPLFELERQITTPTSGDGTPDATGPLGGLGSGPGPGPEGPKIPTLLSPFDHPDQPDGSDDLGSDQPDFEDYAGSSSSERLEDDVFDREYRIDEEDFNPCKAPWRPDGYEYDLCCIGKAFLSRQVTGWKYDVIDLCDFSESFCLLKPFRRRVRLSCRWTNSRSIFTNEKLIVFFWVC